MRGWLTPTGAFQLPTIAERFLNLFSGLERAYGRYNIPADAVPNDKGKVEGIRATVKEPVTLALWEAHLSGKSGIGIIPAREDGNLRFAAIDIDVYPLDLKALALDVARRHMPLIVCRTKSGGAHCYFFSAQPLDAATVRDNMKVYAAILGYPGVEVFPKQDRIEGEDYGNWINMPYFGGARSMRYALSTAGEAISIDEFLATAETMQPLQAMSVPEPDYYEGSRMDENEADDGDVDESEPEQDQHEQPQRKQGSSGFGGAPPCLITLSNQGFPSGTRNNALFNLGVYAKKARPEGWQDLVKQLNERLMIPPLGDDEVIIIIKSLSRKRYFYKCKDHPIAQVCDKKVCMTREHGVGGGASVADAGLDFGDLTKVLTKPVMWLWDIDGEAVEFDTADLMNQALFQAKIMELLSIWPPTIKTGMWRGLVQSRMDKLTEIAVPEDATMDGQLWEQLARFCTSRVVGNSLDELLLGKPYTDGTRSHFVSTDFLKYLSQNRFASRMNEKLLYVSLRSRDLKHHRSLIRGTMMSYWSVPAFEAQNEEHDVPRQDVEGAM